MQHKQIQLQFIGDANRPQTDAETSPIAKKKGAQGFKKNEKLNQFQEAKQQINKQVAVLNGNQQLNTSLTTLKKRIATSYHSLAEAPKLSKLSFQEHICEKQWQLILQNSSKKMKKEGYRQARSLPKFLKPKLEGNEINNANETVSSQQLHYESLQKQFSQYQSFLALQVAQLPQKQQMTQEPQIEKVSSQQENSSEECKQLLYLYKQREQQFNEIQDQNSPKKKQPEPINKPNIHKKRKNSWQGRNIRTSQTEGQNNPQKLQVESYYVDSTYGKTQTDFAVVLKLDPQQNDIQKSKNSLKSSRLDALDITKKIEPEQGPPVQDDLSLLKLQQQNSWRINMGPALKNIISTISENQAKLQLKEDETIKFQEMYGKDDSPNKQLSNLFESHKRLKHMRAQTSSDDLATDYINFKDDFQKIDDFTKISNIDGEIKIAEILQKEELDSHQIYTKAQYEKNLSRSQRSNGQASSKWTIQKDQISLEPNSLRSTMTARNNFPSFIDQSNLSPDLKKNSDSIKLCFPQSTQLQKQMNNFSSSKAQFTLQNVNGESFSIFPLSKQSSFQNLKQAPNAVSLHDQGNQVNPCMSQFSRQSSRKQSLKPAIQSYLAQKSRKPVLSRKNSQASQEPPLYLQISNLKGDHSSGRIDQQKIQLKEGIIPLTISQLLKPLSSHTEKSRSILTSFQNTLKQDETQIDSAFHGNQRDAMYTNILDFNQNQKYVHQLRQKEGSISLRLQLNQLSNQNNNEGFAKQECDPLIHKRESLSSMSHFQINRGKSNQNIRNHQSNANLFKSKTSSSFRISKKKEDTVIINKSNSQKLSLIPTNPQKTENILQNISPQKSPILKNEDGFAPNNHLNSKKDTSSINLSPKKVNFNLDIHQSSQQLEPLSKQQHSEHQGTNQEINQPLNSPSTVSKYKSQTSIEDQYKYCSTQSLPIAKKVKKSAIEESQNVVNLQASNYNTIREAAIYKNSIMPQYVENYKSFRTSKDNKLIIDTEKKEETKTSIDIKTKAILTIESEMENIYSYLLERFQLQQSLVELVKEFCLIPEQEFVAEMMRFLRYVLEAIKKQILAKLEEFKNNKQVEGESKIEEEVMSAAEQVRLGIKKRDVWQIKERKKSTCEIKSENKLSFSEQQEETEKDKPNEISDRPKEGSNNQEVSKGSVKVNKFMKAAKLLKLANTAVTKMELMVVDSLNNEGKQMKFQIIPKIILDWLVNELYEKLQQMKINCPSILEKYVELAIKFLLPHNLYQELGSETGIRNLIRLVLEKLQGELNINLMEMENHLEMIVEAVKGIVQNDFSYLQNSMESSFFKFTSVEFYLIKNVIVEVFFAQNRQATKPINENQQKDMNQQELNEKSGICSSPLSPKRNHINKQSNKVGIDQNSSPLLRKISVKQKKTHLKIEILQRVSQQLFAAEDGCVNKYTRNEILERVEVTRAIVLKRYRPLEEPQVISEICLLVMQDKSFSKKRRGQQMNLKSIEQFIIDLSSVLFHTREKRESFVFQQQKQSIEPLDLLYWESIKNSYLTVMNYPQNKYLISQSFLIDLEMRFYYLFNDAQLIETPIFSYLESTTQVVEQLFVWVEEYHFHKGANFKHDIIISYDQRFMTFFLQDAMLYGVYSALDTEYALKYFKISKEMVQFWMNGLKETLNLPMFKLTPIQQQELYQFLIKLIPIIR